MVDEGPGPEFGPFPFFFQLFNGAGLPGGMRSGACFRDLQAHLVVAEGGKQI